MKKALPYLLLFFVGFGQARAQVRLGLLGGIQSSNILETNSIPGWDSSTKKFESAHTSVHLGILLDIPLGSGGLYFQPGIVYTGKGRQFSRNYDSAAYKTTDTLYSKQTLNLGYIEIPLNLTYKFPLSASHKSSFFISAGPYVSFFYSGKLSKQSLSGTDSSNYSSESDPLTVGKGPDTYKTIDLGINARSGFEFGNVMLSGFFSRGLSNFYTAPYSGSFHHQVVGASLCIWLGSPAISPTTRPRPAPAVIRDQDGDGIPDTQDLCPLQPGVAAWHGCPVPDFDHDGIDDEHDSCKTIPGVARYNGCPIPDSDHDGINDEEDKCPNEPGTVEDHGCPPIKKEVTEKINYTAKSILFDKNSDKLDTISYRPLNDLATLLKQHPEWHLTIEGHTDNSGDAAKNLVLSQQRADQVKVWLVGQGVPDAQLTAIGYGQERPVATNTTLNGKAANRRVELKLNPEK